MRLLSGGRGNGGSCAEKKACNYLAAMLKNRQIDICLSRELFLCGVAAVLFVFIN